MVKRFSAYTQLNMKSDVFDDWMLGLKYNIGNIVIY